MPGTTTNYAFRYQTPSDPPDGAALSQNLAEDVDTVLLAELTEAASVPFVRLVAQAVQSMTSGVAAAITYGASSEEADTHNFHSTTTNPTRVTPNVPGWYECVVTFSMGSAAISQMLTGVKKNGTNHNPLVVLRPDVVAAAASNVQAVVSVSCNGSTDYIEHIGQYNSVTTPLNTSISAGVACTFEVTWKRPL